MGEPLNHIYQDTKSAQLIAVCKRSLINYFPCLCVLGMQPVLYSCKEAHDGDPGWVRAGTDICYYKNHYKRPNRKSEREKFYFTLTFTIEFPYSNDQCYLAYHYPYSFSLLEVI